jgi:hypothetical protein
MKNCIKVLSLGLLSALLFVTCSKDNDPADDNLFVGTYNGSVSYTEAESSTDISTDNGSVTLVKVGDSYNFDFSDGIPSLTGITMEKNENTLINSDGLITIDEGTMIMAYTEDGEVWGANCTR